MVNLHEPKRTQVPHPQCSSWWRSLAPHLVSGHLQERCVQGTWRTYTLYSTHSGTPHVSRYIGPICLQCWQNVFSNASSIASKIKHRDLDLTQKRDFHSGWNQYSGENFPQKITLLSRGLYIFSSRFTIFPALLHVYYLVVSVQTQLPCTCNNLCICINITPLWLI